MCANNTLTGNTCNVLNAPKWHKQQAHITNDDMIHICPECKTKHSPSDLILFEAENYYSYSCKKCGDVMESNWNYYW